MGDRVFVDIWGWVALGHKKDSRHKERPLISFTDLTSMVLMNELGIKNILTEDHHFFQIGMGFQKMP